jgi:hypothetical protein
MLKQSNSETDDFDGINEIVSRLDERAKGARRSGAIYVAASIAQE